MIPTLILIFISPNNPQIKVVNQSRLKTIRGPGLILKWGPYLVSFEKIYDMRGPLAYSVQWINTTLSLIFSILHEKLVRGPLFNRGPWAAALKALALIWPWVRSKQKYQD